MAPPDPSRALALPVDELALEILADLVATNAWNEHNYLNAASQDPRYRHHDDALRALAEALTWLRARVLIARAPGQTDSAIFVTRAGHAALKEGLTRVRAAGRLHEGLHSSLERHAVVSSCWASTSRRSSWQ
jgi:hypothetical protein